MSDAATDSISYRGHNSTFLKRIHALMNEIKLVDLHRNIMACTNDETGIKEANNKVSTLTNVNYIHIKL